MGFIYSSICLNPQKLNSVKNTTLSYKKYLLIKTTLLINQVYVCLFGTYKLPGTSVLNKGSIEVFLIEKLGIYLNACMLIYYGTMILIYFMTKPISMKEQEECLKKVRMMQVMQQLKKR